jgi:para-aminobenzoate synthetase component 1
MGGVMARDLVEVSSDPSCLADGGFWAVSTTYEGEFRAAKFKTISSELFPSVTAAAKVVGKWESSTSESEYIKYVETIRE